MKKNMVLIIGLVLFGAVLFLPSREVKGLGQRLPVQYIRAIAAELELTVSQAENLTMQQAYNYLISEYPALPAAKIKEFKHYWPGIKIMLVRDAKERRTLERLVLLRQQLNAVYPDAVGLDSETAKDLAIQLLPLLHGEVDPNALD